MSARKTKQRPTQKNEATAAQALRKSAKEIGKAAGQAEKPKPVTQRKVLNSRVPDTCPQGGDHDWTDDECSKCHEPKPQPDAAAAMRPDDGGGAKSTADRKGAKTPAKSPKSKVESKPQKLSAIDAAAKVLAEAGEPMTTCEMIEVMAAKGYWSSPNGQTPAATLYSAILRQINAHGKDARFKKVDRGQFTLNG